VAPWTEKSLDFKDPEITIHTETNVAQLGVAVLLLNWGIITSSTVDIFASLLWFNILRDCSPIIVPTH